MNKGFTIVELAVVIVIIVILSAIILFSVSTFMSKGKDSNISANLAILIPSGEVYYNSYGNSYLSGSQSFCTSSVVTNALLQMPAQSSTLQICNTGSGNPAGVCCHVATDGNSWAACVKEFTDNTKAYCVDSRGVKKEITGTCTAILTQCP